MISQARLEANRRNAKKSTGPRTEEGKRRSSLNAITHGMTARIALLPDEDQAAFDRRMVQWVQELSTAERRRAISGRARCLQRVADPAVAKGAIGAVGFQGANGARRAAES